MVKKSILQTHDSQMNAVLLVTLISPVFLGDYELQEDGLHCFFIQSIDHIQKMIKTFLNALYEITNQQFYFEIINDHEAILKIYGEKKLQFSQDILFRSTVSSQKRELL
ncbi:MAG: hypothetical protein ACFFB5_03780 [Promethearchaeota archaeon]